VTKVLRDARNKGPGRNRSAFLPCGAEPEGSVELEGDLASHTEVLAYVGDFTVLALLAWRANFDGDDATLIRLC